MSILVIFAVLFVLLSISVPVGLCIGGSTIVAMVFFSDMQLISIAKYAVTGLDSLSMLAIPMFMLAGTLMSVGGIARRLVDVASAIVGHIVGGLGAVVALSSMFFGAISGSSLATVSAIGSIMVPQMTRKGYDLGYSAVFTACAGTIGAVIPPSIPLVIFGVATSTSIGDLFIAGIIPGVAIGIGLMIGNYFVCKKNGYTEKTDRVPIKGVIQALWDGKWALFMPVLILGGIYTGIFTPTEAAVVSVVYAALISMLIYKEISWSELYEALKRTAIVNGITSFLLGISTSFAAYLSMAQIPILLSTWLSEFTDNKIVFLMMVNIVLLIIGCFMDNIPATIILGPMLLPAMTSFGVDPVQYGLILSINLLIGLVTPPYGCSLFTASAVCGVSMEKMLRHLLVPFSVLIIVLLMVTYIPAMTLCLV